MATEILKTPFNAPGFHVPETLRDAVRVAVTEAMTYSATSPATTTVCRVPANTLVMGALVEITTAFAGTSGTLSLGDSDSATVFLGATTDIFSTGIRPVSTSWLAKNYTAAQDIIATFSNAASDSSAGAARFWLLYKTESDKQLTE